MTHHWFGRLLVSVGLVVCVNAAFAQGTGTGQAPGGQQPGGQAPKPGGGGATQPPGQTPQPQMPTQQQRIPQGEQQTAPDIPRPIYLSGRVMLEEGGPPPEPVVIERVCNGQPRPEGFTDSKGRFSFELGRNALTMVDASVSSRDPFDTSGGFGSPRSGSTRGGGPAGGPFGSDPRLLGCELRAALPGYRSDVINLTQRRSMDNPEVGTIVLHRIANVEGTTISATSLNAPKEARKAYDKGLDAMKKNKWSDAQKQFEKAVTEHPKYAAAWYELGVAQQQQKNIAEARKSFAQSLDADPKYVKPYLNLAMLASADKNWEEVAKSTDTLLKLNPVDFPQAYVWNSIANLNLHKPDAAEKSVREALKLAPGMAKLHHILGLALANQGNFSAAVQEVNTYVQAAPEDQLAKQQLLELQQRAGAAKP